MINVADATLKLALAPLNFTDATAVKLVPVIVTLLPTDSLVGEKPVMVGAGMMVKLDELVAVPPGVVTLIEPLVAPAGTVALIDVADTTLKMALVSLNFTAVAPMKFVPVMVTLVPTGPIVGEKLVIVGAGKMTT